MNHPLCVMCLRRGIVVEATVADHVENHEGNWIAFLTAPLQSLCKECHDGDKRYWDLNRVDRLPHTRQAIGTDGWPLPEPSA
jgi:hypothetical protein